MSYDDHEKGDHSAFDFHYRATQATQRRIEAAWTKGDAYCEWAWLRTAINNGRGYALDEKYQDLCKRLVYAQTQLSKVVLTIIERELAAEASA